ncbi:hypothetical protein K1T71_012261 [Dendrolimus kikuchii]|uniref:Uncharacterized protein n=1 Tax=Dendrolimus kikuchii TaxID=765133 RepID=A0ACC1CL80_9NEOP|nr:hypothetical protein K1T71_012261 [Dendrolimus kikuchii]
MRVVILFAITFMCLQTLECQVTGDARSILNSRLNFFDIDLLRYTVEDKKGNVMVSPLCIRNTLTMLLKGAFDSTAAEITRALRLSPVIEEQNNEIKIYLNSFPTGSDNAILENANALFTNKNLKLKKEYENTVVKVHNSEVLKVDFKNPTAAANLLNEWVNKKTKGHIPAIIQPDQIDPTAEVVVANAVYFKSLWKYAFKTRSRGVCFYSLYRPCFKVPMMELDAVLNYRYVPNLRAHAVELPYQGDRYSMILLIPRDRDGATSLVRDLPFMSLPQIAELMEPIDVRISMPKFTVTYGEDMVATLRNMRVKTLFEPTANLSGIFEGTTPHVTTIYHKVYMSVDENGTVAAAASVANVVPLINSGVELRVDRPFVFFIRDNKSGFVLFEGKIEEPVEYPKAPEANHPPLEPEGTFPAELVDILNINEF